MLVVGNRRYKKKQYVIGGAGIFDSILQFLIRTFTSQTAKEAAKLGLPPVPDYPGRPGFETLCPASWVNPIRDANCPGFLARPSTHREFASMIQIQCTNFSKKYRIFSTCSCMYICLHNFGPNLPLLFTLNEIWSIDSQENH